MNQLPGRPTPRRRPASGNKKNRPANTSERKQRIILWAKRLGLASLILFLALGIGTGFALLMVYQQLPDVRKLENYTLPQATEIYSSSGRMLTRLSSEGRYDPVPLADMPKHVQDAVISAEDRRFWQHEGVDFLGLMRAISINLSRGKAVMGASTITQQLIKNLFLTPEQTAKRKVAEALLAFQLERTYSKDQILELYMNMVFLGHNVFGFEAAAQIYFGKSTRNLTIAEAALLAGIIRSPEYYSPYHNPEKANALKEIVLNQMAKDQLIKPEQLDQAMKQKIQLVGLRTSYAHPYFLDYVSAVLRRDYGDAPFRTGGWKVYTTLDPTLQTHAESLLTQDLPRLQRLGASQAALVAIDPRNGHVRALVGGVSYRLSQFNRAFQAQRQPGSAFKPFVYVAGFEKGKTLQTTYNDVATNFGGYRPRNYDRRFHGQVSLLQSLTQSLNIPTIKLAEEIGMGTVADAARRAGVKSPVGQDLSAAIGSSEMNLLELTSAYGTFAQNGARVEPTVITRIVDNTGKLLYEHRPEPRQVLDASAVAMLNAALKNVINAGTGTAARIGRPAAGKTGTTDQAFDTWFVGYVPQLVTGIWAGNDNPSATRGGGGSTCAPLWRSFMLEAVRGLPIADFAGYTPTAPVSASASASASATSSPSASNSISEVTPEPTPSTPAATEAPSLDPTAAPTLVPIETPIPLPTLENLPEPPQATATLDPADIVIPDPGN